LYAKLFTSIYQGTLRGNSHGLLVFTNLLAHADSAGIVDIHPKAIADEVGLSEPQVRSALDLLESPDDESRSPEEAGRRIVRVDEHRAWGWRIVNHAKYRAIRNEEDRREQNRLAQAKWREKNKPIVSKANGASAGSAHTEADTEAEAVKKIAGIAIAQPADFTGDSNLKDISSKAMVAISRAFELPAEWGTDAESLGWKPRQILKESERFRQYWTVGKGQGKRRTVKGWRQAWSNWLSKAERMSS
jgi:hypothetical protein